MRYYTDKELSELRRELARGKQFCCNNVHNRITARIWLSKNGYIMYSYFGTSAIKNTNCELRWLIETILDDCDDFGEAYYSKFDSSYHKLITY